MEPNKLPDADENSIEETIDKYKQLDNRCERVLTKIKKRKLDQIKNGKKK